MGKVGLSGIYEQIADILDEETAFLLAENFGGTEISIPNGDSQLRNGEVVRLIGEEKTIALAKQLGWGAIRLPQHGHCGTTADRRAVYQQVFELRKQGKTHVQIAREVGYSMRQVSRILGAK